MSSYSNINWEDVIKKEARGLDDADLGEVQEIGSNYILTQKGVVNKDKYYIPKSLASRFDGHNLWFNITENEVDNYKNNENVKDINSISTDSTNTIDEITRIKNQDTGHTNHGYLNRNDRYESDRDPPNDVSDITDKSISHRGTYRDMINDPNLSRNTITTDDNYDNRDIESSTEEDTLHDNQKINKKKE